MKENIKVYLAGKISSNGWRQKFVNIRDKVCGDEKWKIRHGIELKYNDHITVTGPFFLSCDHSCYHGDNTHGVGLGKYYDDSHERYDCYGEQDVFSRGEVKSICLSQIRRSDVVFAYINSNECFGTLYEIGYARAIGKKVIIVFDNAKRYNDMWFIHDGDAKIAENENRLKCIFDEMVR